MRQLILCLVLTSALFISCKKETPIDYAIISGTIINKDMDSIGFSKLDAGGKQYSKNFPVSENGTFRDTLYIESGHFNYFDGKRFFQLYLEKGANINLSFDTKDIYKSMEITGEKSEISNYLLAKEKKKKELLGEGYEVYKVDEEAFISKMKEFKDWNSKFLETNKNLPEHYINLERENIEYEYLSNLVKYEGMHSYFANKPGFKASSAFPDVMKDFKYDNIDLYKFSQSYRGLLSTEYMNRARGKANSINHHKLLNEIATNPNDTIKNDILYSFTQNFLTQIKVEELESFYNTFIRNSSNIKNNEKITKTYNLLIKLAKGSPSPKFNNYENYDGGTTSLDDLKGKYVYIDVWATWCGPCKAEVPFLKEVEKKYHGKNIEFVSISVDVADKHDAWKAMVKENELKGIQLIADKDFKSEFIKEYAITGIPQFILLDPNGNIINSNAPRPSDPKLVELFDESKI